MEMDKETKELLNQAIQMGLFKHPKRKPILARIKNALENGYEIDKQVLEEAVETYEKILELKKTLEKRMPMGVIAYFLGILIFIEAGSATISELPILLAGFGLLFFGFWGFYEGYIAYLNSKLNSNLTKVIKPIKVLKPKSGRSG